MALKTRSVENVFNFTEPQRKTVKFCKTRCIEKENLKYLNFSYLFLEEEKIKKIISAALFLQNPVTSEQEG